MVEAQQFDLETMEGRKALRAAEIEETKRIREAQFLENISTPAGLAAYRENHNARTREIREEQRKRNREAKEAQARGGGCSRHSFRCPQARDMAKDTPECCKRNILEILAFLSDLLTDIGATWWIDYGTLLGQIRFGGLIPWDKDGDLGIMAEDRDKLLASFPRIQKADFFPTYGPPRKERFRSGDRVKVRLSQRNRTNVDIFIWNRRPEGMLDRTNYIKADLFKGREFPEEWLHPITFVDFDGIRVASPAQAQRLAEHRYGPDWDKDLRVKHPLEVRK